MSIIIISLLSPRTIFFNYSRVLKGISIGENQGDTHAEEAALAKMRSIPLDLIPRTADLLVVRFSRSGKLCSSRPCYHCIMRMMRSNIKIRHVYYSTPEGTIACEKLKKMLDKPIHITKGNLYRLTKIDHMS